MKTIQKYGLWLLRLGVLCLAFTIISAMEISYDRILFFFGVSMSVLQITIGYLSYKDYGIGHRLFRILLNILLLGWPIGTTIARHMLNKINSEETEQEAA